LAREQELSTVVSGLISETSPINAPPNAREIMTHLMACVQTPFILGSPQNPTQQELVFLTEEPNPGYFNQSFSPPLLGLILRLYLVSSQGLFGLGG